MAMERNLPLPEGLAWPEALTAFLEGGYPRPEGEALALEDPATGQPIGSCRDGGPAAVNRAAAAARAAFDRGTWRKLPVFERGQVLRAVAAGIEARSEQLARLEAVNGGKPVAAARREVAGAARVFTYYAGAMDKFFGETIPISPRVLDFTLREPIGVVAQVVPWNFPLLAAAWKLAPALAAGCCCLLKPSPLTPLSALVLAEICTEAGVPPGVIAVLPGGADVGRRLVEHPGVDAVSFTGSTAVGARVMQAAAVGIRPVALELGGKNPFIVFADADPAAAAAAAVPAAFGNAGQSCSARSMILVERPLLPAFVEAFAAAAAKLRAGSTLDEATTLGPLICAAHRQRVEGFVKAAGQEGARLVAGGRRLEEGEGGAGHFYAPTIFTEVQPRSLLLREEIFGPVAAVVPFDSEAEALSLANGSPYGLNATIWTRDLERALCTARDLRCGMVAINGQPSASSQALFAPFGGMKQSGIGRELGMGALEFYTEIKNVTVMLSR